MIYASRYRDYRSFGHGPIFAAMLAPPPHHVFIFAAIVGVILGVIF